MMHYGPMTRSPSFDGFVDRLSGFSFLPPNYPSYRVLTFALVGLPPTEYASLRWTHQHAGLSRRTPCGRPSVPYLRSRSERGALNGPLSRFLRFLLDNESDFAGWTMEAWATRFMPERVSQSVPVPPVPESLDSRFGSPQNELYGYDRTNSSPRCSWCVHPGWTGQRPRRERADGRSQNPGSDYYRSARP